MPFIPRIFIASDDIIGDTAEVRGSDFNHIIKVLRKGVGDKVTACDMHSNVYEAEITGVGQESLSLRLGDKRHNDNELPFKVAVYQCLPKGEKADTVVQKSVELGAAEIVLVMSERCVARPDGKAFAKRLERLARISESAAAQCGRSYVPQVRGLINYSQAVSEISAYSNGFVCYEGDCTATVKELLSGKHGNIAFLIGPEGGLSANEAAAAKAAGIPLANLGKRILRTETAALYVLSAVSVLTVKP